MRRPDTLRLSAAVLLACAALASAHARADDTYSLKRHYKAGESDTYRMDVTIEGEPAQAGMPSKMSATLVTTEKTKEVRPDGTVVVQTVLSSGTVQFGETKMPIPTDGQPMTATIDPSGKVTKVEGGQGPLAGLANLGAMSLARAGSPRLKVGEPSKFDTPTDAQGTRRMKGTVTLVSVEKPSEAIPVETLKVKTVADGSAPGLQGAADQKVHIDATVYVETTTGKSLRLDSTVTGANAGFIKNATVTVKRVRVAAPPKEQ